MNLGWSVFFYFGAKFHSTALEENPVWTETLNPKPKGSHFEGKKNPKLIYIIVEDSRKVLLSSLTKPNLAHTSCGWLPIHLPHKSWGSKKTLLDSPYKFMSIFFKLKK
jgi:hypothetical protein